jgi:hypothetical protein
MTDTHAVDLDADDGDFEGDEWNSEMAQDPDEDLQSEPPTPEFVFVAGRRRAAPTSSRRTKRRRREGNIILEPPRPEDHNTVPDYVASLQERGPVSKVALVYALMHLEHLVPRLLGGTEGYLIEALWAYVDMQPEAERAAAHARACNLIQAGQRKEILQAMNRRQRLLDLQRDGDRYLYHIVFPLAKRMKIRFDDFSDTAYGRRWLIDYSRRTYGNIGSVQYNFTFRAGLAVTDDIKYCPKFPISRVDQMRMCIMTGKLNISGNYASYRQADVKLAQKYVVAIDWFRTHMVRARFATPCDGGTRMIQMPRAITALVAKYLYAQVRAELDK